MKLREAILTGAWLQVSVEMGRKAPSLMSILGETADDFLARATGKSPSPGGLFEDPAITKKKIRDLSKLVAAQRARSPKNV